MASKSLKESKELGLKIKERRNELDFTIEEAAESQISEQKHIADTNQESPFELIRLKDQITKNIASQIKLDLKNEAKKQGLQG